MVDAASFDRLVACGPVAQPLHGKIDRSLFYCRRGPPQRQRRVLARIERRQGVEGRGEGQRLPLFDGHVADVRRVDRLDAPLAQRFVHSGRNQIVRHVVKDLILVALFDHLGRRLAGPETGNARLARVVARDAIDFRIDHVVRDLDAQILARLVDVDNFGLHGI